MHIDEEIEFNRRRVDVGEHVFEQHFVAEADELLASAEAHSLAGGENDRGDHRQTSAYRGRQPA
jgi:hypothetical protein